MAAGSPAHAQQSGNNLTTFNQRIFKLPPADIPNVIGSATLKITIKARIKATPLAVLPSNNANDPASTEPITAIQALERAAANGQPTALWRLGVMYERGDGVDANQDKAFAYFSEIANSNAEASPTSPEARIIARSFIKISDYLHDGYTGGDMPPEDSELNSQKLLMHAASYFGDPKAQYNLGSRYLQGDGFSQNTMRGARWLSLAAQKGHIEAQAKLGDLLFNGEADHPRPVEGLMWLKIALEASRNSDDEIWINALYEQAISIATVSERAKALDAAKKYAPRFAAR